MRTARCLVLLAAAALLLAPHGTSAQGSAKFEDVLSAVKPRVQATVAARNGVGVAVPGKDCLGCEDILELPDGTAPMSVAKGPKDEDLFVASAFTWKIWHVNLATRAVSLVYEAPSKNPLKDVPIDGIDYDPVHGNLWACGSLTGKMTVYRLTPTSSGSFKAKVVSTLQLAEPYRAILTEVQVYKDKVFITDGFNPHLYVLPSALPAPGKALQYKRILLLGNEKFKFSCVSPCVAPFDEILNGISVINDNTVLISNSRRISVFRATLNYTTNTAAMLEMRLPTVVNNKALSFADNMRYAGNGTAWIADTFSSQMLRLKFNKDFSTVTVTCVLDATSLNTASDFEYGTGRVWAMNAKFMQCPMGHCPGTRFELLGFKVSDFCY